MRLHRRVRALEKAASLLASYFCSLFLFGCLRLLSGARYGNTPCLLLSVLFDAELAASPPLLSVPLVILEDLEKCARP